MFGSRRKRAQSNPAVSNVVNASASATTAAAQAFLGTRPSSSSLSAAAAAAALKNRPMTPTSVADVQTKRTVRRTNSTSSAGSSVVGSAQGRPSSQLERRGSQSSMTERSFREPSPNRGPGRPSVDDAPPVPAIPKELQTSPMATNAQLRRPASLSPTPQRISSPLPKAGGRGSSLGPSGGAPAPKRSGPRVTSVSSMQELTGAERPARRGSVNFSLPTNMRPMSPHAQRQLTSPTPQSPNQKPITQPKEELVYDPNTRSFLPKAELLFVEQQVRNASQPAKRKKKISTQAAPGSHLADGTIGGRIKGTAVDNLDQTSTPPEVSERIPQQTQQTQQPIPPAQPAAVPPETTTVPISTQAPKRKKKKKVDLDEVGSEYDASIGSEYESDTPGMPGQFNTRAGALLSKKPSIVREDREREEAEDDSRKVSAPKADLDILDTGKTKAPRTSPPSSAVEPAALSLQTPATGRGHGSPALAPATYPQSRKETRSASQPAPSLTQDPKAPTAAGEAGGVRNARVQSVSPVRTAHFLPKPETVGALAVKHDPPARSISPRKSALKHSPSPRGLSPAGTASGSSDQGTVPPSELSSAVLAASEEQPLPRKKAVRVSFDDGRNVVLGQAESGSPADSPTIQSPQSKRSWFGIGRGKKRDTDANEDEADEIMTPRPMLPTFGSVREKKSREFDERPLVKPTRPTETSTSPPVESASISDELDASLGQSADHAIGAVLSQDLASRNEANISRSREPLPPQVTSVEGNGYLDDSGSETQSIEVPERVVEAIESQDIAEEPLEPVLEEKPEPVVLGPEPIEPSTDEQPTPVAITKETETSETSEVPSTKTNGNGNIPDVSITQATPTQEEIEAGSDWPTVPGAFPSAGSDSDHGEVVATVIQVVEHHPTELTPAAVGIAEPEPLAHAAGTPPVGEIAIEIGQHRHSTIYEESEEDSIYSDAAEDLSDLEGDGFLSLDAVVESPIVATFAPKFPPEQLPESPTAATTDREYRKSSLSKQTSQPDLEEGWDKAQQYWSGLTAERKRELERAARGEVDEESDGSSDTEVPEPAPPVLKEKSPERYVQVKPKAPAPAPQLAAPPRRENPYARDRKYQIQPGSRAGPDARPPSAPMRSSMRSPPPVQTEEGGMRRSMRSGPGTGAIQASGGSMRRSMRNSVEEPLSRPRQRAPVPRQERPMSYPPPGAAGVSGPTQGHARNLSTGAAASATIAARQPTPKHTVASTPVIAPTLRRKGSDDSESSFRRARPSKEGGGMRRSMRGSIQQGRQQSPEAQGPRSSRFSMRSISPPGTAAAPPVAMRSTMRSHMRKLSNDSNTPTLRSEGKGRARSPLSLFGRSKPEPSPRAKPMRSSRFEDSSDEEDARPSYRSRFVDSSDEEADTPRPVTSLRTSVRSSAVRGIPRRSGVEDGDSSDLPDSDDEKPAIRPKSSIKSPVGTAREGNALASGSLRRSGSGRGMIGTTTTTTITGGPTSPATRPEQKRRSSLMSILRRKKDPAAKVHKVEGDSGARLDTPLERSRAELAMKRQDSDFSLSGSPKLQKRHPNRRMGSETWPLPTTTGDDQARPFTSDGLGASASGGLTNGDRPTIGGRRLTDSGLAGVEVIGGGTPKKKKKFGRLRRAFGLDE